MPDNMHKLGFRWMRSRVGGDTPIIERWPLASGFRPTLTVSTAFYLDLQVGDPVIKLSTGYIDICAGAESDTPATQVYGIVMGFKPMWNATREKKTFEKFYPNEGITWGTNQDRRIEVLVCPAWTALWEVDVDENSTANTEAAYLAFRGENANHIFDHDNANNKGDVMLDIEGHATSSSLLWRIVDFEFGNTDNREPSGAYVKALVEANAPQIPAGSSTGV